MELNAQINTFEGGMNLDADLSLIKNNQYRYARNVHVLSDTDGTNGVLQNVEKIRQCSKLSIPPFATILGYVNTTWFNGTQTEDCIVVLTVEKLTQYPSMQEYSRNTLYRVTGLDTGELNLTSILITDLKYSEKVQMLANYESQKVSNIYITDGKSPIKVINIQNDYDNDINGERFSIIPNATLNPFTFAGTTAGSLKSGKVQYCYTLFNVHGGQTVLSPLSSVITLYSDVQKSESSDVYGTKIDTNTGIGCLLSLSITDYEIYDRVRIYRIHYTENNQNPTIHIVGDADVTGPSFSYSDIGESIGEIVLEELQRTNYQFYAQILAKLNNRLFAANITETTWDVENYDSRVYRCNIDGEVILHSLTDGDIVGTLHTDGKIYSNDVEVVVPENHDAIGESIIRDDETRHNYTYVAGTDKNRPHGGTGPNISYRFLFTEIIQSDAQQSTDGNYAAASPNMNLSCSRHQNISIKTYYENGTEAYSNPFSGIPNYSDPTICASYLGYLRDEVYRFGIIFYNDKSIASPVHWIGDIRMPATDINNHTRSLKIQPFHCDVESGNLNKPVELLSYALGIEFTVNIPEGVTAYEIVRCDRTETDRTIVGQVAMSRLGEFDGWGDDSLHAGEGLDIRPYPWLTMTGNLQYNSDTDSYFDSSKDYAELISPEICFSRDLILDHIKNSHAVNTRNYATYFAPYYNPDYSEIPLHNQQTLYSLATGELEKVEQDGLSKPMTTNNQYNINLGDSDKPFCLLGKYYLLNNVTQAVENLVKFDVEDAIIGQLIDNQVPIEDYKTYAQVIGEKLYINASLLPKKRWANHGYSCIIQATNIEYKPRDEGASTSDNTLNPIAAGSFGNVFSTCIFNLKSNNTPYQGYSHSSRANSVYISCGCYSTNGNTPTMCYGGDTYLGVLDFQNTVVTQSESNPANKKGNQVCTVCYVPFETSINLNLRHDKSFSRTIASNGTVGNNLIQVDPVVFGSGYVQDTPLYQYNAAYSAQSDAIKYVSKGIYTEDILNYPVRIIYSELKTNNELIDSWLNFKVANYIDVDHDYGQITNLKTVKNRLYYFQDHGVGIAAVNERSLIQDNNVSTLTLGTGDVLSRYDYLVEHNGSSIINDKSILATEAALYWYDYDKNELCQLSTQLNKLSKSGNVQTYFKQIVDRDRTDALTMYDHKYDEVWFKIVDESLIYNERLGVFTAFYDYAPQQQFHTSDKLITISDRNWYMHNSGTDNKNNYFNQANVQFVINDNLLYTKVYDNQQFSGDFTDIKPVISKIQLNTKYQIADVLTGKDIECREDTYRFAIPREQGNSIFRGRMRGKYLLCDYTFDCADDKQFRLPYIKTIYRYSRL